MYFACSVMDIFEPKQQLNKVPEHEAINILSLHYSFSCIV